VWGGGAPSPLRERSGEGAVRTTSTEKKFEFGSPNGDFWRILGTSLRLSAPDA